MYVLHHVTTSSYMNTLGCVVPGAGAFEVALHNSLLSPTFLKTVSGRARLGVQVIYLCVRACVRIIQ